MMGRYVIRRMLWILLVVLLVTLFAFVIFFVLPPGDPAVALAGRNATPDTIKEVKKIFGLDRSLPMQYVFFLKHLFLGDQYGWPGLGFSFSSRTPVKGILFDRLGITMMLAGGAAVIWLVIGIPIGILSALKPRSIADRFAMVGALFFISAPVFWLGQMALFIFWFKLHWAPTPGYVGVGTNAFEWFTHMLMPWFVLAVLFAGTYARLVRGNMLEVMGEDYIRTARAKGLPERQVIVQHGLRASLTPVVTLFGLDFGGLVGGAIVTETVFNLPGMGRELVQAVFKGDLPVVMAIVVIASLGVTLMNLVVDILYAYLDPRVRYA
ncbi:MAG: ABC transporter permease [Actinomycetota bacterium]